MKEEEQTIFLLDTLTTDEDREHRVRAAKELGKLNSPYGDNIRMALERKLVSLDHPEVRVYAALALGERRDRKALPVLAYFINKSFMPGREFNPEVAMAAVHALGEIKDGSAVPVLVRVFNETTHRGVRAAVATALASIGNQEATNALLEASSHESLQDAACAALKDMRLKGLSRQGRENVSEETFLGKY